jgi:predicted nucleic acid-binding protein
MLVVDTSTLQALHRGDLLALVAAAFERVAIARAVFDETARAVVATGPERAPDLAKHPRLDVATIDDTEIESAGAIALKPSRATTLYRWLGRQIHRPELESVILAKRDDARLAIEEKNGVKCAADFGVRVVGVADLIVELERGGHVTDARARARRILDRGFDGQKLRWLARGISPYDTTNDA